MIALAVALLLQQSEAPRPPCWDGTDTCAPWDRTWDRWITIGTDTKGTVWSADTQTMKRSREQVRVWMRLDHSRDATERARRSQGMLVLWCAQRRYGWEDLTAVGPNGKDMPLRWTRNSQIVNVPPESMVEAALDRLCPEPAP